MLITPDQKSSVPEVDASTLSPEEWFAIYAVNGLAPDASYERISEFRRRAFGSTRAQQMTMLRAGMESLVARGIFGPVFDKEGKPVCDAKGDIVYEAKGRIVYTVRPVETPASKLSL